MLVISLKVICGRNPREGQNLKVFKNEILGEYQNLGKVKLKGDQ
jgi:hypothetical protein